MRPLKRKQRRKLASAYLTLTARLGVSAKPGDELYNLWCDEMDRGLVSLQDDAGRWRALTRAHARLLRGRL